jgi:hypothetical protein
MTRWEALVRYDDEIREAALKLIPFGDIWVDRLGKAFFALNEDRKYLPNMVEQLVKEAEHEAEIENHRRATAWLQNFSTTREGEATSEEALGVLLEAQVRGYQVTKGETGIIGVGGKNTVTSYLWSNADIIRFGKLVLKR